MRPGARLGIDPGSARIGVASSDPGGLLATPLQTVRRGRGDLGQIAQLAAARQVTEIVVGLPTSLSGNAGQAADQARDFAERLAGVVAPIPVRLVDERFTTVIAHAALALGGRNARERRTVIDQAAAALLLQGALDAERQTGAAPGVVGGPRMGGAYCNVPADFGLGAAAIGRTPATTARTPTTTGQATTAMASPIRTLAATSSLAGTTPRTATARQPGTGSPTTTAVQKATAISTAMATKAAIPTR